MSTLRVSLGQIRDLVAELRRAGYVVEELINLYHDGWRVRYKGHWMQILWNKNNKQYTVDKRLDELLVCYLRAGCAIPRNQEEALVNV